jgi:hypothetical protein
MHDNAGFVDFSGVEYRSQPLMNERALTSGEAKTGAFFLAIHIVIMFAGFTILGIVFEFPDVLRYPASERFALFIENQGIIVPTYWALAMTGFTQIIATVFVWQSFGPQRSATLTLFLVFGLVAGFGQAMGFGRWAVLIPYLAETALNPQSGDIVVAAVPLLEESFNRYAGMLVGEHLSNIAWGIWLLCAGLSILRHGRYAPAFGWLAVIGSPILFLLAGEQLGLSEGILGPITDFGFPLLAVWHFGMAWAMLRPQDDGSYGAIGPGFYVFAVVLYSAMVGATFMG